MQCCLFLGQAGVDNGQFASALVGFINVAGTVVAALLIEKCGRKQLLSLSFTGDGTHHAGHERR